MFYAPVLSLYRFNEIVHVHRVVSYFNEMVITDKDFCRADLTEGCATAAGEVVYNCAISSFGLMQERQ